MPLVTVLRNKLGIISIIAVGISTLAFILSDTLSGNKNNRGSNVVIVGEVAGEPIDRDQYNAVFNQIKANYSRGQAVTDAQLFQYRNLAWNQIVAAKSLGKEYDKLGITVTEDEKVNFISGTVDDLDENLKRSFTNPETQEFDDEVYRNQLQSLKEAPKEQRDAWTGFINQIADARLRLKYESLLLNSIVVTDAEAEAVYHQKNDVADVSYAYVTYYTQNDSTVNVTDVELQAYLDAHEKKYEQKQGRSLKYINIEIAPSAKDTTNTFNELDKLKADFTKATNDSTFALLNRDSEVDYFKGYSTADLPIALRSNLAAVEEGAVFGPIYEKNKYVLYKVNKITTDTVSVAKASHILFRAKTKDDPESEKKARDEAQQVLNQIIRGADFAEMARKHGSDGTASKGGDLGWGVENKTWVKEFQDPIFKRTSTGLIKKVVKSQFGYHLISVTGVPTNKKYFLAKVDRELYAGDETKDSLVVMADNFIADAGNIEEFERLAKEKSLEVKTVENIAPTTKDIQGVPGSRQVISWLYSEAEEGMVSDRVFETDDSYLIAVMTGEREAGPASLKDVRPTIETIVKNQKKAKIIIEKLKSLSGTTKEIAGNYGADASAQTQSQLKFADNSLPGVGFSPLAVGLAFSLEKGQTSEPVAIENGVIIITLNDLVPAADPSDLTKVKDEIKQARKNTIASKLFEAVKEEAEIENYTYKVY